MLFWISHHLKKLLRVSTFIPFYSYGCALRMRRRKAAYLCILRIRKDGTIECVSYGLNVFNIFIFILFFFYCKNVVEQPFARPSRRFYRVACERTFINWFVNFISKCDTRYYNAKTQASCEATNKLNIKLIYKWFKLPFYIWSTLLTA